jgi:hypothetical protein
MTWQEQEAREEQEEQAEAMHRLHYGCSQEEARRREARSLLLRLSVMGRLRFEQAHGRMDSAWLARLRSEAGYSQEVPDCEVARSILASQK